MDVYPFFENNDRCNCSYMRPRAHFSSFPHSFVSKDTLALGLMWHARVPKGRVHAL